MITLKDFSKYFQLGVIPDKILWAKAIFAETNSTAMTRNPYKARLVILCIIFIAHLPTVSEKLYLITLGIGLTAELIKS